MTETTTGGSGPGVGADERRRGFFARLWLFLREVVAELKKVVRPSRQELLSYTAVVLVFVVVVMAIVFGLDLGFGWLASAVFGSGS